MKRISASVVFCMCCLFGLAVQVAHAQTGKWPEKPVRLIIASAAGSGDDIVARTIEPSLAKLLSQPLVVENRAGAAGWIGQRAVLQSAPDGYTFLLAGGSMAGARYGNADVTYDVLRDFTPISLVEISAFVMVANVGVPAKNLKEFIALARAHPGKMNFSTGGPGEIPHWSAMLFNQMAGIKAVEVPYKDFPLGVRDVMAGSNDYVFTPFAIAAGNWSKLRALGVTSPMRSPAYPEIPTIAEAGLPGYELPAWRSIMGPAGVSQDIVSVFNVAIARALATPEVRERLRRNGSEPSPSTPDELTQRYADWIGRFGKIAKQAGIKPQ